MKKWIAFGIATGITLALAVAGLLGGVQWYKQRPQAGWRNPGLSASRGEIGWIGGAPATGGHRPLTGLRVSYTLTNTSGRDIRLAQNALIRLRENDDAGLEEFPVPVILSTTYFSAEHATRLHVEFRHLDDLLQNPGIEFSSVSDILSTVGLNEKSVSALVILDSEQRFELVLPKPFLPPGNPRVFLD